MVKVWRQALVEGAAEVELDGQEFPARETRANTCAKWILYLTGSRSEGWSRTRRRNRAGRSWHARGTR